MARPYHVLIQIHNADKGKMDRTEIHFPKMSGETSKDVADRITQLLDAAPEPPATAVSEHDRLLALQNEAADAGSDSK